MTTTQRGCAGESDFGLLHRCAQRSRSLGAPVYCAPGELDWWRAIAENDPLTSVRIWVDSSGGRSDPLGFAWPDGDKLDVVTLPDHPEVLRQIVQWAVGWRRGSKTTIPGESSLGVWSMDLDSSRTGLLAEFGFVPTDTHYLFRQRDINDPGGVARLPSGYSFAPGVDQSSADLLRKRVEAHREAFAPSRMTVAKHSAALRSPSYRRDLDVVIVDENGDPVAFTLMWFDEANQAGLFEPVGCHPTHQRHGLGRALMLEGIRRLRSFGARFAEVRSEPVDKSPAANALYDSVGLVETDRLRLWRKGID